MTNIERVLGKQREFFNTGKTLDVDFRVKMLQRLKESLQKRETEILKALWLDLRKSEFEAYATELGIVLEELSLTIKKVRGWSKPKRKPSPIMHFPSTSIVYPNPYGIALIMSPWNYPLQLTIAPLIGAIAAGNCAMIKPAKYSKHTTEIIIKIIEETFDEEYISVVEPFGGREAISEILKHKYDYIFFTGSVKVGKVVMEAASKHLTPITLELGGKSPCIVDKDADIDLAARRIVWGKYLNAGQTCVAPDYLLVHKSVKHKLLESMTNSIKLFYGENPRDSKEFPRIITQEQFDRLVGYLKNGDIVTGGSYDRTEKYIAPTIIDNVTWDFDIMKEEIFGPIIPVIEFNDIEEVITLVNSKARPLALYYFSNNKSSIDKVMTRTISGGGCINDTVIHVASNVPFGGVGESGMGGYHGKDSFDTFTHYKSIVKKSTLIDIALRYPPFNSKRMGILKKIMK